MSKNNVREQTQKAFVRIFDSICNWNSRWERWNDMVELFAIEINSAVDLNHREERIARGEAIRKKYSDEELGRFAELFAELIRSLEANMFQDFLGSMYMDLELGNSVSGQFFTPYNVCEAMAAMTVSDDAMRMISERGWIGINDPACGGGATLIAAAGELRKRGINYQQHALFVGQDLDHTVAMMCYIQLSLIGCPGYVRIGNTLTDPGRFDILTGDGTENTWYTPMFFADTWTFRVMMRSLDMAIGRTQKIEKTEQKPEKSDQKPKNKEQKPKKASEEKRKEEPNGEPEQLSWF